MFIRFCTLIRPFEIFFSLLLKFAIDNNIIIQPSSNPIVLTINTVIIEFLQNGQALWLRVWTNRGRGDNYAVPAVYSNEMPTNGVACELIAKLFFKSVCLLYVMNRIERIQQTDTERKLVSLSIPPLKT